MDNFLPVIDKIQKLVNAQTPGEALEKIRAMVKGYPADRPPDDDRDVKVRLKNGQVATGRFLRFSHPGAWSVRGAWCNSVVRWWELPR